MQFVIVFPLSLLPCYPEHSNNCPVLPVPKVNFVKYCNWLRPPNLYVFASDSWAVWSTHILWSFILVQLTTHMFDLQSKSSHPSLLSLLAKIKCKKQPSTVIDFSRSVKKTLFYKVYIHLSLNFVIITAFHHRSFISPLFSV